MQETGLVWAGFGLGAFATVGAILTLGLVRRWGERFPRWMLGLAGRRVPATLAVVPATLVAIAVTAATLGLLSNPEFWRRTGGFGLTGAPMLLWPLWVWRSGPPRTRTTCAAGGTARAAAGAEGAVLPDARGTPADVS